VRGPERRLVHRRTPAATEPLARIRLRGGRDCVVLDISSLGALVEGSARLLPSADTEAQIVTRSGRLLVRCRIVRAYIGALTADEVSYRCALRFDRAIDVAAAG